MLLVVRLVHFSDMFHGVIISNMNIHDVGLHPVTWTTSDNVWATDKISGKIEK